MKNAEELKLMAHKIINEYAGRVIEKLHATALEFSIYDALQDAYQKGAEDMEKKLQPWNYLKRAPEGGAR